MAEYLQVFSVCMIGDNRLAQTRAHSGRNLPNLTNLAEPTDKITTWPGLRALPNESPHAESPPRRYVQRLELFCAMF